MKMFESQMVSFLLHAAVMVFVVFYFVPPKVINQGHGMMVELMNAKTPKGQKKEAPKVAKSKKEIMSKPVVIATKPKIKKALKKPQPKKKVSKAPIKVIEKKAIITQKEKSIIVKPNDEETAQSKKAKLAKNADDRILKAADKDALLTKEKESMVSRSTGRKPAPPAAAPIVGEKKYSLAEALGKEDGIKDARKLTQIPGNLPPTYPTSDRLDSKEGQVTILAYVNGAGQVEDIKIENSTGSFLMEAASVRSFSRYRFSKNQPGWVRMPFEFQLKGPAKELHAQLDDDDDDYQEPSSEDLENL